MKRSRVALLALTSLFSTMTYAGGDTIRFGTDATFPPFESITPEGDIVGFEVDIGNAICKEMNKKCEWVSSNFDGLIPSLKVHKIDAVFSSLGITEKRKKTVTFTDVIWTGYSSMLSRKAEHIEPTVESLKGKTIGVQMGSMQEEYVSERFGNHGATVKTYQDQDAVYSDLMSGRIDVSFQDMIQAKFNFIDAGKHHDFSNTRVEDKLLPADSAVAVRKDDEKLAGVINEGLKKIRADGTYDRIQQKYFGDLQLYKK